MNVKSVVSQKDAIVLIKGMKRSIRFSSDTTVNYSGINHNGRKIVLKYQPDGLKGDPKHRTVELRVEVSDKGQTGRRRFRSPKGFYKFFDLGYEQK